LPSAFLCSAKADKHYQRTRLLEIKIFADWRVGELSKAQWEHKNFAAKIFLSYRITPVLVMG
jgi:hypothetical protein